MNADALLAEILTHPDEDAPRLVYADWLDDHGDADRATFIRIQVRHAWIHNSLQLVPYWEERAATDGQVRELLTRHREEWMASLPRALQDERKVTFHRGFVEELKLPVNKLLKVSG